MRVKFESGRVLQIPARHHVYVPVGGYSDGDPVDPATVDFEADYAERLVRQGQKLIVDNVVEVVSVVGEDAMSELLNSRIPIDHDGPVRRRWYEEG
jgi:hypothetical protein